MRTISAMPPPISFNPRSPRGERPPGVAQQRILIVSIHAPRVGSDWSAGATPGRPASFNPRSPRGERPSLATVESLLDMFQSTLPAWGATFYCRGERRGRCWFQSTLPAWGATIRLGCRTNQPQAVSIHAPRVGSDALRFLIREHSGNVSIHAPRVGSDPIPVEYARRVVG